MLYKARVDIPGHVPYSLLSTVYHLFPMNSPIAHNQPFEIKDCALVSIATGKRAQNLRELRENLLIIHPESIYYHFWGWRLRPRFEETEYNNDFAEWAHSGLRDNVLAERLSVVDPTGFDDMDALRSELVDILEERLDESEHVAWSKTDQQFYFVRSQIVVFNTKNKIKEPVGLATALPQISLGSIFYHFIDARRRTENGKDDFSEWLSGFGDGYEGLMRQIGGIDPFFHSLTELRRQLTSVMAEHFGEHGLGHLS